MGMGDLSRLLITFGLVMVGLGLILVVGPKIPLLGRLPGDFLLRRGGTTIYVPLASSIVLSLILTVLINLFFFWR